MPKSLEVDTEKLLARGSIVYEPARYTGCILHTRVRHGTDLGTSTVLQWDHSCLVSLAPVLSAVRASTLSRTTSVSYSAKALSKFLQAPVVRDHGETEVYLAKDPATLCDF